MIEFTNEFPWRLVFKLLTQSLYLLKLYSHGWFPLEPIFIVCIFLRICLLYLIYWYILVHIMNLFISVGSLIVSPPSFIFDLSNLIFPPFRQLLCKLISSDQGFFERISPNPKLSYFDVLSCKLDGLQFILYIHLICKSPLNYFHQSLHCLYQ